MKLLDLLTHLPRAYHLNVTEFSLIHAGFHSELQQIYLSKYIFAKKNLSLMTAAVWQSAALVKTISSPVGD